MRAPTGQEMWGKFVYREINAPERLVFANSFCDDKGVTMRAPFNPNWPLEILNTVTVAERDGRTVLAVTGSPFNAMAEEFTAFESMRPSMDQGFKGTFEQLDAYLAELGTE